MKNLKFTILFLIVTGFISATLHEIILVNKTILNDKVDIKIPQEFNIMQEEHLKIKYPAENRPELVYTDQSTQINVAFNHIKSKANQDMIEDYKSNFVDVFKKRFPDAEWIADGVTEINGKKVGYLELITPAVDTKIYNLLFFTDLEGKLLLCTFNCTEGYKEHWEPSAKEIMNSLTIKE